MNFVRKIARFWRRLPILSLKWWLTCVLLMGVIHNISAEPLKFRRYSLDQGLSQGTIRTIVQDDQGFMWFGTQDGLNRFDGYQFDIFIHQSKDPNSLRSDYIRDLYQSPQGDLYVATRFGLSVFNRHNETFTPIKLYDQSSTKHIHSNHKGIGHKNHNQAEKQIEVNAIIADSNNTLWVASLDGLFAIDLFNNKVSHFKHQANDPSSLPNDAVYSLLIDKHGTLWVGTETGLSSFVVSKQNFKHWLKTEDNPNGNNISSIVEDHHDNLWIGTYNSGLIKLNPAQNKFKRFVHQPINDINAKGNSSQSLAHNRVRALLIDKNKQLWIGTRGGLSIMQLDNEQITNHYHQKSINSSLSDSHIWSMYADDNDSIWLGTSGGISQHIQSSKLFGHRSTSEIKGLGINYKKVRSLFKTTDEHLWVGTDKGLNHFNPNTQTYQYYTHDSQNPATISKGMITAVLVDKRNRVWAGSYDGGLNLLLPNGQFKRYFHQPDNPQSISNNRVYSIMQDNQGDLWVGTLHGLNRFNPSTEKFQRFYHQKDNPDSLGFDGIYATMQSGNGDIWIATRGGGLSRYSPTTTKFNHYKHNPQNTKSLSHNRVFAVHQNSPDNLWVATSMGLNKLDIATGEFTRYGKEHGLNNDTVYAVSSDQAGFIWVSTNRGLARFDPVTERFKSFDKKRGLQSNEYNNGAYFKATDGELFFGGINGFNRFYPLQIEDNLKPPKLVISQFYLANQFPQLQEQNPLSPLIKVANQTQSIELNHQQPVFSFEFAALHYIDSTKNRYAYMLQGFDDQWTYTSASNRRATYTNLPAGEYVFKFKAANSDGIWTTTPKSVYLTIHAAPWFTWWAYLIYASVLGSIICAFIWQHWHKQISIKQSERRLQLALWSSGNQFWDWDFVKNRLIRSDVDDYILPTGDLNNIKSLRSSIHPDDYQTLVNTFNQHLRGYSDYFECAYRIKDHRNQWIWLLDRGKVVKRNEKGKALRAIGTVQDITEFKAAESQLRELNEQLEQRVKNRTEELASTVDNLAATIKELTLTQEQLLEAKKAAALGNLVAGVAHELNTPIGICITSISTLNGISNELFEKQHNNQLTRRVFTQYQQTCQQSLQLVTDNLMRSAKLVQTFKMIAVEQHSEERSLCQLNEHLQGIISSYSDKLKANQISLEITGDPHVTIESYGNSLDVIFSQLLDNSLQHGFREDTKGKITISILTEMDNISVRYHDNGCGLCSNSKEKLFDPFFTTNRTQGQTGLGMHIVFNHITQKLRGTIKIDDKTTNGLGYVIQFPIAVRNTIISEGKV